MDTDTVVKEPLQQPYMNYNITIQQWVRPVVILLCGMLLFNLPILIYKIRYLYINGILYFCFNWDKTYKKPLDPYPFFAPYINSSKTTTSTDEKSSSSSTTNSSNVIKRKTVYFVRHGESTWNDTFNQGKHRTVLIYIIGFIPRLIQSFLYEMYLLLSGKMDSWYFDAPLSHLGIQQIQDLAKFLNDRTSHNVEELLLSKTTSHEGSNNTTTMIHHLQILRGDPNAPSSKLIASNLRRAVSTIIIGFQERLYRRSTVEKILIVPYLQEMSHNPDTLSITPPHTPIQASWIERTANILCYDTNSSKSRSTNNTFQQILSTQVDMSLHTGNKPIQSNGLKRIMEFCDMIFSPSIQEQYIIVGGHSLWFRTWFQLLLPYHIQHVAKQKKIINGGIIVFDVLQLNDPTNTSIGMKYMIDPKSIQTIYGGF